jgi:hypothetical protein
MMNLLGMTLATHRSAEQCQGSEGLPRPGIFPIEAKLGIIVDESKFIGKSIEYRLIQFAMFRQKSKIIKRAGYLFIDVVFALCRYDPSGESGESVTAAVVLQSMLDAIEMS